MPTLEDILKRGKLPPEEPPSTIGRTAMDFIVGRKLKKDPRQQSEIQRICNIPVQEPLDESEMEAINELHVKPSAKRDFDFKLERAQIEALQAFAENEGAFAPIEVGGGKTLISLRTVGMAFEQGIQRAMLCVPPEVLDQLVGRDIAWTRQRVPLGVTFFNLGGKSPRRRREMTSGQRGCWILPYSLLSTRDTSELLERIRPQLIVFDEAHMLKNRRAARTRRILSYFDKYKPKVVVLSGTITKKSIKDFAHLLVMALGKGAPVPFDAQVVSDWAAVLDSEQGKDEYHSGRTATGPLRPLINWSNAKFPREKPLPYDVQGFRWAFRDRLVTTPGYVSSPAGSLGTALTIQNRKVEVAGSDGADRLLELMKKLEHEWLTPGGDEIEHAMLKYKWETELSGGFYNDLVWPEETEQNAEALARSQEHHELRQYYHKELRAWFNRTGHREGLDTPMLVGGDMARNGAMNVGGTLYTAWAAMKNAEFDGMVERRSVPVRVCDYKVRAAIKWMQEHELGEGIVWCYHTTLAEWLAEEAKAAGVPSIYCPAGKISNRLLTSPTSERDTKGKFLICSISAHGTGKNLQYKRDQLFVQFPSNEAMAQQAIGRTHRKGQDADTVYVTTMISNKTDELALAGSLNDAIYVFETQHGKRKLLDAVWDPMPTIYGSQVLRRAGLQTNVLNAKQTLLLQSRFSTVKEAS